MEYYTVHFLLETLKTFKFKISLTIIDEFHKQFIVYLFFIVIKKEKKFLEGLTKSADYIF
jgi:hypothetical protein